MARCKSVRRFVSLCLCGALCALSFLLPVGQRAGAAPKAAAATESNDSEDDPQASGSSRTVRLNYLQASWSKVLRDFATATGSTLVADRVPSSKFTRMDRAYHSTGDALKILNQELESQGFRLLVKSNFLVLVDLPSFKTRYPRPVVTPDAPGVVAASPATRSAEPAADDEPRTERTAKAATRVVQAAAEESPRARPTAVRPIRQAAGWSEDQETPAVEQPDVERAVKIENHRASRLAQMLYDSFKSDARLFNAGPLGLPGFHVRQKAATDKEAANSDGLASASTRTRLARQFTVSIDEDANELIVQASPAEAKAVVRLIMAFDAAPVTRGTTLKAVTTTKDAAKIAGMLQPELDRLAAASRKERLAALDDADENAAGQGGQDAAQPAEPRGAQRQPAAPGQPNPPNENQPAQPGQPERPAVEGLLGGLKSEVQVEAVPDLGVLILRGNQKDVDAVMSIIREIEKLSAGTAPIVNLMFLRNVSSEGLASLLTSVYERLSTARGRTVQQVQTVTVIPVARPNALLIIASTVDMPAVEELVDKLDQPVDPQTEFQVFRLKQAVASQVEAMVRELYPAPTTTTGTQATRAGLGPRLVILADVRTNSVIVLATPRDLKEVAVVIRKMDQAESAAVSQVRIFQLKNAVADDLVVTLQTSIQSVLQPPRTTTGAGGQFGGQGGAAAGGAAAGGATELRDVKSTVLQYLSVDGKAQRLIRSGILADIRFTADARTNSLVVTAPEKSMELVEELVKILDKPSTTVAVIRVLPVTNGDASQMITLLQALFPTQTGQQQGGQGGGPGGNAGAGLNQIGVQVAGAEDASSGLIPLRLSVDVRTNSIIAVGAADALSVVEAIVLRLDESDIRQRQTTVYRLKNISAIDVSNAVNQFLTTQRQVLTQAQPELLSPFEQIEREVVVVPEPVSNNLLISATPRYFKEITELVKKLDAAPQQVIIQALLVEVTLDNTDEFGMEIGLQDSLLFRRSVPNAPTTISISNTSPNGVVTTTQQIIGQTSQPGFPFNNQPLGNNIADSLNPQRLAGQSLSNFSLGRQNNDLGYGGLVLSAGSESVSLLLRALAARRRVDVLSRPQIRTLDNQLAQIQVGQIVPTVTGGTVSPTTGQTNPVIAQKNTGILLTVTPRISPDQQIVMSVIAEKSALNGSVPLSTGIAGAATLTSPIFDITTARAVLSVRDGQTVVVGGMITKTDENTERKVPLLGDIPILGLAFRYDLKRFRRTELLIFLTPRVIRSDGESELIKQIETERIHFIEQDAEEIHGPIMALPGATDGAARPGDPDFPLPPVLPRSGREADVPTTEMLPLPAEGPARTVPPPPPPPPLPQQLPPQSMKKQKNNGPALMRGLTVPESEEATGEIYVPVSPRTSATPPRGIIRQASAEEMEELATSGTSKAKRVRRKL